MMENDVKGNSFRRRGDGGVAKWVWNNGFLLSFLSGLVASLYSLMAKLSKQSTFLQISFTRGILIGCFMFVWAVLKGYQPCDWLRNQSPRTIGWLLARSVSSFGAITTMFAVYQRIPLGDAAAIFGATPVFTGLIGVVLIGEVWQLKHAYLTLLAWSGIALIYKPQFLMDLLPLSESESQDATEIHHSTNKFYMGVALLVPVSSALSFIISRKLSHSIPPQLIVSFTSFGSALLSCLTMVCMGTFGIPPMTDWKYLIPEALLGAASQTLAGRALQLEKAAPVTLMRNSNILASFILQYALYGTVPGWSSLVGAGLVILATALLAYWPEASSSKEK